MHVFTRWVEVHRRILARSRENTCGYSVDLLVVDEAAAVANLALIALPMERRLAPQTLGVIPGYYEERSSVMSTDGG